MNDCTAAQSNNDWDNSVGPMKTHWSSVSGHHEQRHYVFITLNFCKPSSPDQSGNLSFWVCLLLWFFALACVCSVGVVPFPISPVKILLIRSKQLQLAAVQRQLNNKGHVIHSRSALQVYREMLAFTSPDMRSAIDIIALLCVLPGLSAITEGHSRVYWPRWR